MGIVVSMNMMHGHTIMGHKGVGMAEKQKQLLEETGAKDPYYSLKKGYSPQNFQLKKDSLLKSPSIRSILPAVARRFV